MPQLWQGRSSKTVDSRVNDFNSSIRFDARMIEQDIRGSMVHSAMLGKQGIIAPQDVDDIHKGLQSILEDLHSGALEIDPAAEMPDSSVCSAPVLSNRVATTVSVSRPVSASKTQSLYL